MKLKFFTIILTGLLLATWLVSPAQKSNILVDKGLAFLASTQSTSKEPVKNGGPSINPTVMSPQSKALGQWSGDAGITALCLQAFLANGHGVNDPLYGTVVTNAITFLIGNQIQLPNYHAGAFASTEYGYGSAQAIVALQSALNSGGLVDPLRTQVQNAVNLALNYFTQDINPDWSRVSWRYHRGYTSQDGGDMSCNQWAFLALNETGYTGKGVWNKIYNYINYHKGTSGNKTYIGYQGPYDWIRGNTAASIWGLILAKQHGVAAADALALTMSNYLEQYSLTELFTPVSISSHVYQGAGYYYYTYEVAKALSLLNKTNFSGGDWYAHLYNTIESQHHVDGNGNYYWNYAPYPSFYGYNLQTALALLALQTGTVPVGSSLRISLDSAPLKSDCVDFTIYDENGNAAGKSGATWYTNIPNSAWTSTTDDFYELTVDLQESSYFNTEIVNSCIEVQQVELCFKAYILDELVDQECYILDLNPITTTGATAFVNAIGGLNVIIINPPAVIPVMELTPSVIAYNPFEYSHTYNFTFDVAETTGESPLLDIDIFASALADENGNVIPVSAFTFVPSNILAIPAGGSVTVNGTLVTPASFTKADPGLFLATITAQTTEQAKAINFEIGKPTMTATPAIISIPYNSGSGTFVLDFTGFAGCDWELVSDAGWLTPDPMDGTNDATITFYFNQNPVAANRTGNIVITAPDAMNTEVTVEITQDPSPSEADQAIPLPAGWLGISSFIVPASPGIEDVLAGIVDEMEIIIQFGGGFYWPSQNLNFFGDWDTYKGYKIKMNEPALLEFYGLPAVPSVTFGAGLHYLPVLSQESVSASDVFGPAGNDLMFAFNIQEGLVYWPAGGIYTLETLEPGVGYLVRLLNPFTFDFAGKASYSHNQNSTFVNSTPWNNVAKTGENHIISIDKAALTEIEDGSVIGVFNSTGICVGMTEIAGKLNNKALVVYGDDFTTLKVEGPAEGENLNLKLYTPSNSQVTDLVATYDPNWNTGTFEPNGLSLIKSLKAGALGINNENVNFRIYPNPSSGLFNILSDGKITIEVVNSTGQIVNTSKFAGNDILDLSRIGKGVYYMKIYSNYGVSIEKIVIN
jgi:hypothetical protein